MKFYSDNAQDDFIEVKVVDSLLAEFAGERLVLVQTEVAGGTAHAFELTSEEAIELAYRLLKASRKATI